MTNNQIAYAQYLEGKRHNYETESQGRFGLNETARHNRVTETETSRHNVKTENLTLQDILEKTRHNQSTEQISWYNAQTTAAYQMRMAATAEQNASTNAYAARETARHNKAGEALQEQKLNDDFVNSQQKLKVDKYNAETNRKNASTNELRTEYDYNVAKSALLEQQRHNVVDETQNSGFGIFNSFNNYLKNRNNWNRIGW